MRRRITRIAAIILALAAGVAGSSAAHPAKDRSCGLIRDSDGIQIGVVVQRGSVKCAIAKKVVRAYRSDAPTGSVCVRKHHGFTCASAKPTTYRACSAAAKAARWSRPCRPRTELELPEPESTADRPTDVTRPGTRCLASRAAR